MRLMTGLKRRGSKTVSTTTFNSLTAGLRPPTALDCRTRLRELTEIRYRESPMNDHEQKSRLLIESPTLAKSRSGSKNSATVAGFSSEPFGTRTSSESCRGSELPQRKGSETCVSLLRPAITAPSEGLYD